jgi:hypothetical protein
MYDIEVKLLKIANAITRALNSTFSAFNFFANWRAQRLGSSRTSTAEVQSANYTLEVNGVKADEVALANHEHPEYYKLTDTVDEAWSIVVGDTAYRPSELAPANHTHDEYVKKDELVVASYKLGGLTVDQFALADHNHDEEYFKKDEIADAAYTIGGYNYADFSPASHDHDNEYYKKTDIVDDAQFIVDSTGNLYTSSDLAPAEHSHKDKYMTLEEFTKIFLMKDEPYWVSDTFTVDVYDATPNMGDLNPETTATPYELLQDPYSQVPLRPEASVPVSLTNAGRYNARAVLIRDLGLNVGSYITYTVQLPGTSNVNILGGLISVKQSSATSSTPVQVPVISIFNGDTIGFYAPPFRSAALSPAEGQTAGSTVVFDVLLFVDAPGATFSKTYVGTTN